MLQTTPPFPPAATDPNTLLVSEPAADAAFGNTYADAEPSHGGVLTPEALALAPQVSIPLLSISSRTRVTPFHNRVVAAGAKAFTVYNHMLLPTVFSDLEDDYWHLRTHVQVWDVSAERQVALKGPDAAQLAQMVTPRNLAKLEIGRCMYAPIVDETGAVLNDPIFTRVSDDEIWVSIADSDILLLMKGLAIGLGLNVKITEPDVFPLAVQGPKADELMALVFGDATKQIKKFRWAALPFQGQELVVARSGWSYQGGFEIYLEGRELAEPLWDALMAAGEDLEVRAGCPNLIERIESGLLSYGNDILAGDTPLECGLGRYCDLDDDISFVGKAALLAAREAGQTRQVLGLRMAGSPVPPAVTQWPVTLAGVPAGAIRSIAYSPRFEESVAIAMLEGEAMQPGTEVGVTLPDGTSREARVVTFPMMQD